MMTFAVKCAKSITTFGTLMYRFLPMKESTFKSLPAAWGTPK